MALSTRTTSFALPGFNSRRGKQAWDKHTWLYISVIVAVVLGAVVGLIWPDVGVALKPLGEGFVALIKMMIAPIIFCTIVVGVGSIAKAATVGRIGGLALLYFMVMSTFALAIGLVVGNLLHPGEGLNMTSASYESTAEAKTTQEFILGIIPTTFFSAFTGESVLQVLFIALLVGFALQQMGDKGTPIMNAVKHLQALVFRILGMILWLAPLGAFGAIAAVVGNTGIAAIWALGTLMIAFYITCAVFIVGILGTLLYAVARVNLFSLMKYLAREYLLIVGTSSSESALPRLIAKLEHLGVSKPVVGITVPTGYSFNLDGTAIYLTMASLFIASGMGAPMSIGEQIGLLVFMIIASKGGRRRHRRGPGHARRRSAGLPPRPGERRRSDRRHRPVHVGGPRPHELHGQRRGHGADRDLDQGVRRRASPSRAGRGAAVRRDHPFRTRPRRDVLIGRRCRRAGARGGRDQRGRGP